MPIKRIAGRLGVSPASVSSWTRDIQLTPEQRERNLRGPRGPQNPEAIARRVAACQRTSRAKRIAWQEEGRRRAREADSLHYGGCMLYWAEGSKQRNSAQLCNSDPHMIRFFKRFISECFAVEPEAFRLCLYVYLGNGLSLREIEEHWLSALVLPRSCLVKHYVNPLPTSSSGRKRNKLPFGVCSLTVHRTDIVQHIFGAIQEYGGFEEPRWLDGPPRKSARKPD
jgi:hypothetical protein